MSVAEKIPIENIYYLLCYAWNKLEEREIVEVSGIDTTNIVNLFAKVLIGGLYHLLKRGVDRGYLLYSEDTNSLKGKICFNSTLKRNLFIKVQAHCEYDELNYNVLHNRIIKSTLWQLICVDSVDGKLRDELIGLHRRLREVEEVTLSKTIFNRVQLHRNNYFYDFLLKICELVYDNLLVSEEPGKSKFRDFLRDERQMAFLFEEFIRNFYRIEAPQYLVSREDIYWDAVPLDALSAGFLPKMTTDISINSDIAKVIVEAKYYKEALDYHYDAQKIHAPHLYQLVSYLKNVEARGGVNQDCSGVILYPSVNKEINLSYMMSGHKVMIKTINLNQPWELIHKNMISILESAMLNN